MHTSNLSLRLPFPYKTCTITAPTVSKDAKMRGSEIEVPMWRKDFSETPHDFLTDELDPSISLVLYHIGKQDSSCR